MGLPRAAGQTPNRLKGQGDCIASLAQPVLSIQGLETGVFQGESNGVLAEALGQPLAIALSPVLPWPTRSPWPCPFPSYLSSIPRARGTVLTAPRPGSHAS